MDANRHWDLFNAAVNNDRESLERTLEAHYPDPDESSIIPEPEVNNHDDSFSGDDDDSFNGDNDLTWALSIVGDIDSFYALKYRLKNPSNIGWAHNALEKAFQSNKIDFAYLLYKELSKNFDVCKKYVYGNLLCLMYENNQLWKKYLTNKYLRFMILSYRDCIIDYLIMQLCRHNDQEGLVFLFNIIYKNNQYNEYKKKIDSACCKDSIFFVNDDKQLERNDILIDAFPKKEYWDCVNKNNIYWGVRNDKIEQFNSGVMRVGHNTQSVLYDLLQKSDIYHCDEPDSIIAKHPQKNIKFKYIMRLFKTGCTFDLSYFYSSACENNDILKQFFEKLLSEDYYKDFQNGSKKARFIDGKMHVSKLSAKELSAMEYDENGEVEDNYNLTEEYVILYPDKEWEKLDLQVTIKERWPHIFMIEVDKIPDKIEGRYPFTENEILDRSYTFSTKTYLFFTINGKVEAVYKSIRFSSSNMSDDNFIMVKFYHTKT